MPKISVIVPCYNAATYIGKTIEALAGQEFKDFEVIFVDDCSIDTTCEVIEGYLGKYGINGRILKNEENLGPSLTRKYGIYHATAEYIAFCDCDDWYDGDFLLRMYSATESEKNDIVFCNYRLVYSNGRTMEKDVIGDIKRYSNSKSVMTVGIDGMVGGLFRKELFCDLVFPSVRNGEDMAIIPVLISRARHFGYVKQFIYNYFQREGSLSTTYTDDAVLHLQESFDYILSNVDGREYRYEIEFLGVRNLVYGTLLKLFQRGYHPKEAKRIMALYVERFPDWIRNPYIKELPFYKRVFIKCVNIEFYVGVKVLTIVHHYLTR